MNKILATLLCTSMLTGVMQASPLLDTDPIVGDTLFTELKNDIVILSTTKETNSLKYLPAAVSVFSPKRMEAMQINSLKDLSSIVPNYSVASYGSKMTAPIYIRGIGARSGTQTVSMYVDNIPYFNTTSFDIELADIQRIEVLRGTQSTLYGRNAMGGLLNIYTYSPLEYQGTKAKIGGGSYGDFFAQLSHYQLLRSDMGISASTYYNRNDGYFDNDYKNNRADKLENVGGRLKYAWQISPSFTATLSTSFDYIDQGAFPYKNQENGKIAYNSDSYYQRKLSTNGLALRYVGKGYELNSTTGYQYLNDDMNMDQDYTKRSVFQIHQRQNENSLSQEFTIKSTNSSNFQWSNGVFGFYDYLKNTAPVYMLDDGIRDYIETPVNRILSNIPAPFPINLSFPDREIELGGHYRTKVYGGAVFHQSTLSNILVDGLSATVGARLDYEKNQLDYHSFAPTKFIIKAGPMSQTHEAIAQLKGVSKNDFFEFLPKAVVKYQFDTQSYIYTSASRGYKTGGHNVQMFADLLQDELSLSMMDAMSGYPGMPSISKPEQNINDRISFKPEYSWSYELGGKIDLIKDILSSNFALYYMDIKDVQVTKFYVSGGGRMVANAGKARSRGFELGLNSRPCTGVFLYANYGYSHAKFRSYYAGKDKQGNEMDYSNNYIPYAPRTTFSAGSTISYDTKKCSFIDQVVLDVNYAGVGKIYWDEANEHSQGFNGELNARLGFVRGICTFDVFAKNLLNHRYNTFLFEASNNYFGQQNRPIRFGASFKVSL